MKKRLFQLGIFAFVLMIWPMVVSELTNSTKVAHAATLSNMSDITSRNKISTLADHTIDFITPTGITALSQTLSVVFPAGYTMGTFNVLNVGIAVGPTTGSCAGTFVDRTVAATAGLDIWGAAMASQTITFTAPSSGTIGTSGIGAGRCVRIEIGATATFGGQGATQITNPGTAGNYNVTINTSPGDSGVVRLIVINDDDVSISATVDAILGFTISDTAVGFGTFTPATLRYATADAVGQNTSPPATAPVTLVASSNANSGFYIRIRSTGTGSTAGMYNSVANSLIAASGVNSITTSTEAYGAYANLVSGTGFTIGTFSGATSTAALTTSDQTLASTVGPTLSGTSVLHLKANVLGTTEAGAYVDTLTLTCTATF